MKNYSNRSSLFTEYLNLLYRLNFMESDAFLYFHRLHNLNIKGYGHKKVFSKIK